MLCLELILLVLTRILFFLTGAKRSETFEDGEPSRKLARHHTKRKHVKNRK